MGSGQHGQSAARECGIQCLGTEAASQQTARTEVELEAGMDAEVRIWWLTTWEGAVGSLIALEREGITEKWAWIVRGSQTCAVITSMTRPHQMEG